MAKKNKDKQNKDATDPAKKWEQLNTAEGDIPEEEVHPDQAAGVSTEEEVHSDLSSSDSAADSNEVIALRDEITKLKDQLLREAADKQNIRNRMQRDIESARKFAGEKFLKAMLPVVDSLERALQTPEADGDKAMREGVLMTINMFEKVLQDNGVTVITPDAGEAFDPEQHEAMSAVNDPKQQDNAIVSTLQKGYNLHGRVIRAAMVVVNKH